MTWADNVNGVYELFGGVFMFANCVRVYKDKEVKGLSLASAIFFSTWSIWNLYYYPSLSQWASFAGGLLIAITNTTWVSMAIYYTVTNKRK